VAFEWFEADLTGSDRERWDRFQERVPAGTLFHRAAWLSAMTQTSRSVLAPMVLARDNSWEATIPLFFQKKGPLRVCMSPPDGSGIPYLGPTLGFPESLPRARRESRWLELVRGLLRDVLGRRRNGFTRFILTPTLQDVRPFLWAGFRVTPRYNYLIDLRQEPDRLLKSFQQAARKFILRAQREFTFREGGIEDVKPLMGALSERYEEQGRRLKLGADYILQLFETMPQGSLRVFLVDGKEGSETGVITIVDKGTVRFWQGTPRPKGPSSGATEYLLWRVALWAQAAGNKELELVGANTPQLARFKVKFNPSIVSHYMVEQRDLLASLILGARRRLARSDALRFLDS
jgi:Acetyltransferase (GNAT) domain